MSESREPQLRAEKSLEGESATYRAMAQRVRRVARTHLPVLIRGETGAGKERVAQAIHDLGPRRERPFVAVNCAAIPAELIEAELFGVVRGGFTGADRDRPGLFVEADSGTLFLDELAEMPGAMQAKLLRVLETGDLRPVGGRRVARPDVRIVAATHRDLHGLARDGQFREDLLFRLAVAEVRVPPLRDRFDDLPRIVTELIPRLEQELGGRQLRLTPGAWRFLRHHDWPGNVRELHACLARASLISDDEILEDRHLSSALQTGDGFQLERVMIRDAIHRARGCISEAAREIGWTRQKLYRRIRSLELEAEPTSTPSSPAAAIRSSDSSTFQ